jgi:hypothetical protein
MNVTRNVITDLLPIYFSGEASDDTRAIVDEFFRRDPQFAAMAKEEWSPAAGSEQALPQDAQMKTLSRTKRLLRLRSMFLGAAIFLVLLPFSVLSIRSGTYVMWRDMPQFATVAALFGLAFWCAYAWTWYRARTGGW